MTDEAQAQVPAELRSAKDDRRDAIIAIAEETFIANGYAGTSMSAIAARLGGSKGTLYNYFKSKEELFVAVIERKCARIQELLSDAEMGSGGDLRTVLTRFGSTFIALILHTQQIETYRLVTAESVRFPEVGRALYESGVSQSHARMAALLERARDAGQLRSDTDVKVAAEQFVDLCMAGIHRRRLWGITPNPSREEMEANVAHAVTTFLRAFGA